MAEAGVQDMEVQSWQGLAAPRGLAPGVRRPLLDVLQQSLRAPAMQEKLAALGMEVVASSPEAFAARRQAESDRWQQVIQRAGISME
jgi:tripartite-type tricarboxylate transporter receptor subunit TctC